MKKQRNRLMTVLVVGIVLILVGCRIFRSASSRPRRTTSATNSSLIRVTGYCNCEKCCGWKRSWFGFGPPVYTYGKMKGKIKKVGITATGTRAKHGTIAADPKVFPFGTRLEVPGYGVGIVEDIGGAIKGNHIDIWFPTHQAALRWGSRNLKVIRK